MKIRIMLFSTLVLACIAASSCAVKPLDHAPAYGRMTPEKDQEIRRLLEVTGTTKTMPEARDQMIAEFRKALPGVPSEFWEDFRKEINIDEVVDLMVPVYDKHLSLEEIKAANAFFATPAGKRFAEKMPVVSAEGFEVSRKWGEAKGRLVADRLKEKGLHQ